MALRAILVPSLTVPSSRFHTRSSVPRFQVRATVQQATRGLAAEDCKQDIKRRSANWPQNSWDEKFVASLGTENGEQRFVEQISVLKEEVRGMIRDGNSGTLDKLEFIDAVQRLGLGYHFETEIREALGLIRELHSNVDGSELCDLHSTALRFRLFRQHGIPIQQEVFERFLKKDAFEGVLEEDVVKGVLGLYEASFHSIKGESLLDEAKIVSSNLLKSLDLRKLGTSSGNLASKVERALDMPLRWRTNRSEARWFIDIYEHDPVMKPNLLRLAKLDYNFVQAHHRTEVVQFLRWWSELGIERFDVLRNRPMENYLWANMMAFEPHWSSSRLATAKVAFLLTVIDDCYDIFGTVEELELLTDFIRRWDISEIDKLPPVIRSTFLALYNTTNDIAYQFMRDRGVNSLPFLKKMWELNCTGYLHEARLYNSGLAALPYEEYMDMSTNSIGGFVMSLTCFLEMAKSLDKETMGYVCDIPPILYNSCKVVRLTNDLGTSSYELARGDNFKAVQCYQKQHGVSEEEAQEAIWERMEETWKDLNQQEFEEYPSFVTEEFLHACMGFARASHFFYQHGDGHALSDKETKDYLMSLLVNPVPV